MSYERLDRCDAAAAKSRARFAGCSWSLRTCWSARVADEAPAFDIPDEVTVVESDGAEPSTADAPPLLITSADLEEVPPSDEPPLFDEPEPDASSDAFLEQLRDAASGEGSDEFGEDALATFFDDREDDGGRKI